MENGCVQGRDPMWDAKTELHSCPPLWAEIMGGRWFVLEVSPMRLAPHQNQGFSRGMLLFCSGRDLHCRNYSPLCASGGPVVGGHGSVLGAGRQLGRDLPGGGLSCSALNLLDINCVGLAISALLKMRRGGRRGMQAG